MINQTINKEGYIPLTSILGISGTSYALQLGRIKKQLVSIIIKGKETIAIKEFKNMNIGDTINANEIVGWVLSTLYLPHINPYHIQRTVYALMISLKKIFENKEN